MRSRLTSLLAVIGAVTVLVLAGNTVSVAATGKGLLLGKVSTAKKTTTLARTKPGPALSLRTRADTDAPLAVNGTGKVANLNADKLDGRDSADFASASQTAALADAVPIAWGYVIPYSIPQVKNGHGIGSVTWDTVTSWYKITLPGRYVHYEDFIPTIAPTCANTPYAYSSLPDGLLIKFGTGVQCGFGFSIQKIR